MDINRLIAFSLRIGVLAGAGLSVAGIFLWAISGFSQLSMASASSITKTIGDISAGNAAGVIYLAVAILVATPVFRVALSTFYFASHRDRRYVAITLVVLLMLIIALISGLA